MGDVGEMERVGRVDVGEREEWRKVQAGGCEGVIGAMGRRRKDGRRRM